MPPFALSGWDVGLADPYENLCIDEELLADGQGAHGTLLYNFDATCPHS